jgi:hypothetical protein
VEGENIKYVLKMSMVDVAYNKKTDLEVMYTSRSAILQNKECIELHNT